MPDGCETICEKTKTETFNQKYAQNFSTFDVGVFLNSLKMNCKIWGCMQNVVKVRINAGISLMLFLVEQFIIMLQSKY